MKFRIVRNGLNQYFVEQKLSWLSKWERVYVSTSDYEESDYENKESMLSFYAHDCFLTFANAENFMNKKIKEIKEIEVLHIEDVKV
jgi:hypothetical protein